MDEDVFVRSIINSILRVFRGELQMFWKPILQLLKLGLEFIESCALVPRWRGTFLPGVCVLEGFRLLMRTTAMKRTFFRQPTTNWRLHRNARQSVCTS